MKRILIIQTASIGDVILSTPVVEKLHHFFPDAEIDFLLKKGNESLFEGHPVINQLIVWDKSDHKYRNLLDIINLIRDKKYDQLINIQRFASSGIITILSGARHTIGFNKNPFSLFFGKRIKHRIKKNPEGLHEVDRNLKLIEQLTDNKPFPVKLYPSQSDFAKMSQYKTHQYICIAPASLWFTKQYPVEKWVEFLKAADKDLHVYFIGGPADETMCDTIIKLSGRENCLNLAGKLTLLQTAALMKDAQMNYVNDSAPQHLASALNAPVTAIFCSTVPEFGFGPLSDNSKVVQLEEELKCKPCGLHGFTKCPENHFKCAMSIKKEQLLERIN